MKGPILATVALAAMLAGEVPIAQAVVFVRTPPPRPRSMGVVGRSPGPGFVWTGGYWRWGRGRRGRRGRVCVDARQVETRTANRCGLGLPKMAPQSWGLHVRCRPLALKAGAQKLTNLSRHRLLTSAVPIEPAVPIRAAGSNPSRDR